MCTNPLKKPRHAECGHWCCASVYFECDIEPGAVQTNTVTLSEVSAVKSAGRATSRYGHEVEGPTFRLLRFSQVPTGLKSPHPGICGNRPTHPPAPSLGREGEEEGTVLVNTVKTGHGPPEQPPQEDVCCTYEVSPGGCRRTTSHPYTHVPLSFILSRVLRCS